MHAAKGRGAYCGEDRVEQRVLSGRTPVTPHTWQPRPVGPEGVWGSTLEGLLCPWRIGSRALMKEQRECGLLSGKTVCLTKLFFNDKIHQSARPGNQKCDLGL